MSTVKIDGRHISAARDLLKMTQQELADAADVSVQSVKNVENHRGVTRASTLETLRDALARRGIEFMNGDSPGVRLHGERAVIPV